MMKEFVSVFFILALHCALLSGCWSTRMSDSVGVIGGADGSTSVFVTEE